MRKIRLEQQLVDQLRIYRQNKKMSQEQLAEETGLSQQYIARIERGQVSPTLTTLFKMLAALELEMNLESRRKSND